MKSTSKQLSHSNAYSSHISLVLIENFAKHRNKMKKNSSIVLVWALLGLVEFEKLSNQLEFGRWLERRYEVETGICRPWESEYEKCVRRSP
jgi:hypothetical protein